MTPPAAPVMLPMIIATQKGYPKAMLLPTPTTVNSARPMVSKMKKVLLSRMSQRPKQMTHNKASPVQIR